MEECAYDAAFMFKYSERSGTYAAKHLPDNVPEDVDLIDCIEMLVDTVMAGRGRSGHLTSKYIEIDPKVLYRAYWNSVKKLNDIVQVANSEE